MEILVLNANPSMEESSTSMILNSLIEGAKEVGANVNNVYLKELNMAHCTGCLYCCIDKDGKCVNEQQKTEQLKNDFSNSDIIILATPIHIASEASYLKICMERIFTCLMIGKRCFSVDDEIHYISQMHYPIKKQKFLFVANSMLDFDGLLEPILDIMKKSISMALDDSGNNFYDYMGSIIIGYSELLKKTSIVSKCDGLFAKLKQAGKQLGEKGCISDDVFAKLNMPVYLHAKISIEDAINEYNKEDDE